MKPFIIPVKLLLLTIDTAPLQAQDQFLQNTGQAGLFFY